MLKNRICVRSNRIFPFIEQMKTPDSDGGKLRLAWDMVV